MSNIWPCWNCGKPLTDPTLWVRPYNGTSLVMIGDDESSLPIPADDDPGWYPVGAECGRRLRRRGVLVHEDKETKRA